MHSRRGGSGPALSKPLSKSKVSKIKPFINSTKSTTPISTPTTSIHTSTVSSQPITHKSTYKFNTPTLSTNDKSLALSLSTIPTSMSRQFPLTTTNNASFTTLSSHYAINQDGDNSSIDNPNATPQKSLFSGVDFDSDERIPSHKQRNNNNNQNQHNNKEKGNQRVARANRGQALTSLLGVLSYSYLARTAANTVDIEPDTFTAANLDDSASISQHPTPQNSQARKKRIKKEKPKAMPSTALDLNKIQNENEKTTNKLRSNIISADAVQSSIHNIFRQYGVNVNSIPNNSSIKDIMNRHLGGNDTKQQKSPFQAKLEALEDDLNLHHGELHDDANPFHTISTSTPPTTTSTSTEESSTTPSTNDINEPLSTDFDSNNQLSKRPLSLKHNLKSKLNAKKHEIPDLQRSIFQELDGIVEFANLHYDTVIQALSQHSLSALYPPELLTVEFFDYRLELFTDACAEDLGALLKAKKILYQRHLKQLLDNNQLTQDEYQFHYDTIEKPFQAQVVNLQTISQVFQTIPFKADTLVQDLYGDDDIGWTSRDTTFVRNLTNSLEDELKLVQAVQTSLTEDIFSVNQFKKGLNIAAHRYPNLNVSIEKYIQQLSHEHQSITRAVDEYTELTDQLTKMGRASHLTPLQDHVLRWFKPLAESIDREVKECRDTLLTAPRILKTPDEKQQQQLQQHADLRLILPYIAQLKSTELGCIALHETLSRILNAPSGMRVIDLSIAIGRVVNTEANLLQLRQDRQNFQRLRRYYPGAKLNEQVIRRAVNNQNRKDQNPSTNNTNSSSTTSKSSSTTSSSFQKTSIDSMGGIHHEENAIWSDLIQAKVGSFLIKHMLQSSSIKQHIDPETGALMSSDNQHLNSKLVHEVEVPAFVYEHRQVGSHYVGYLTCHADVRNVIDRAHTDVQTLAVRLLPMVIPPRPWRGVRDGGYLSVPSSIIRSKGSRKQVAAVDASDVKSVQDSLNYLGRVAWGINNHVLNVIEQAWSEGGGLASMPSRRDIPFPAQPTLNLLKFDEKRGRYYAPSHSQAQTSIDPEALAQQTTQWRQWQRDTQRISQYNADLHSLRCDLTLRLNQAKQLANYPIHFPLNLDFRGRAYPIPPHLNHLGSDLARALLLFHHKKPLGPKGLYWLKAHLAAQFGVDKVSFDDRVKYVDDNLQLVRDTALRPMHANVPNPHYGKLRNLDESLYPVPLEVQEKYARVYIRQQLESEPTEKAKKTRLKQLLHDYAQQGLHLDMSIQDDPAECEYPLDGERDVRFKLPWWQLADNPWQALSTCYEIIQAIDSGNPETYETGLPVHQDGSCNGLQHYAALGRDYAGGSRVNLTKSDKPQDVYSHVLNEVKRRMQHDIDETDNPLAKMLLPHMARKVVKQTVMTSVYGVTFIGARDQILKQLRDLKDVPWEEASSLVLQQQIENRKKAITRRNEHEQRKKTRERNQLLRNMTEAERVDFLNQEMMEQTIELDNDAFIDPLDDEDQSTQSPDVLIEGSFHNTPKTTIIDTTAQSTPQPTTTIKPDEQGVLRISGGDGNDVLMTQRQAQEAAMRASSIYLARLTLTSLGTVFSAATRIMSWLTECAGIISKQEQPVSWITPMQLPVVQHYRLIAKYQVKTLNQTVTLHHDNDTLPVSPQRQRAAFPPNFVHSLDATHMMLTATECAQSGLVFSSVHDSYWTHPGDVDKMNALLRDRFIHLYSGPVLEDLRESFVLRYPTAEFPPLPARGDLNLEEVRTSPYFFN